MNESPENSQCSSTENRLVVKDNLDQILQLPLSAGKGNRKKRKREGSMSGSAVLEPHEYLDKMSTLQQLRNKEKELKIAIAYEKLRREQPVLLNTDILHEKIAGYEKLIQEVRNEQRMKNVMCLNLQLAKTLQRIVGKTKTTCKQSDFSDDQRKCIKDLLKKKKDLNKRISVKRKEIAKEDENILEMEQILLTPSQKGSEGETGSSLNGASTETDNLKELERLQGKNEKVAERIHLIARILQSLIPHSADKWQEDPELLDMMAECEKVSKSQLDRLDDIDELLTSVCSVNL